MSNNLYVSKIHWWLVAEHTVPNATAQHSTACSTPSQYSQASAIVCKSQQKHLVKVLIILWLRPTLHSVGWDHGKGSLGSWHDGTEVGWQWIAENMQNERHLGKGISWRSVVYQKIRKYLTNCSKVNFHYCKKYKVLNLIYNFTIHTGPTTSPYL
jgi:hypothetical protein